MFCLIDKAKTAIESEELGFSTSKLLIALVSTEVEAFLVNEEVRATHTAAANTLALRRNKKRARFHALPYP